MTEVYSYGTRDFYSKTNVATRIDAFEELTPTTLAALRTFFRKLGAQHFVDEVIVPTLQEGDAQVFCAVRDRPWPPWGLGARTITAVCEAHTISPDCWAIGPVYALDEEVTNTGLIAAVYREALESIAACAHAEVCYLAAEGSVLLDHVLRSAGFGRDNDVLLTEHARYYTYRANAREVLKCLGLREKSAPDLLAQEFSRDELTRNALFQSALLLAARAELRGVLRPELVHLPRGGHSGKPGGVPSGTGTDRPAPDQPGTGDPGIPGTDELWFVAFENFLGQAGAALIDEVTKAEAKFRPATVTLHEPKGTVVDERIRRALTLDDVGFVEDLFAEKVKASLEPVLRRLGLTGFDVGQIEIQVTASRHGDYFRMHRDADGDSTRMVSFVYFFHAEPRQFSGGELRLFDDARVRGTAYADQSQLLSPRQDLVVFFPSRLPHELLPVRVPTKKFRHSRFAINGWVHRALK